MFLFELIVAKICSAAIYITANQSGHGNYECEKVCSLRSPHHGTRANIFKRLSETRCCSGISLLFSCILRSVLRHFSSALAINRADASPERLAENALYKSSTGCNVYHRWKSRVTKNSFFKGTGSEQRSPVARPNTLTLMLQDEETLRAVCVILARQLAECLSEANDQRL